MKSYTDIEQSKKLAEILPLESADMYYTPPLVKGHTAYIPHLKRRFPIDWEIEQAIPCWSLANLLEVIPDGVVNRMTGNSHKWEAASWNGIDFDQIHSVEGFDNPTDACYEMVLKLHELGLL